MYEMLMNHVIKFINFYRFLYSYFVLELEFLFLFFTTSYKNMTSKSIDLDSYKDEIIYLLFYRKLILDVIIYFKDSYNFRISRRIL